MKHKHSPFLWDLWCALSVVGIWPRYLEPNLLDTTKLTFKISDLPPELDNLRIVQFSDLHLNQDSSPAFLKKLSQRIQELNPDVIVFTGDFLCYSQIDAKEQLQSWLNTLHAPYGCYAIFGNHDYEKSVSVNEAGEYDIISKKSSSLFRAFARMGRTITIQGKVNPRVREIGFHEELVQLLHNTPFILLHNDTKVVSIKGSYLNICGVGEYMLGKTLPEVAYRDYDERYPGIILAHNPDAVPHLKGYPGNVYLSGHTHGAQVNLPWFWKKFTLLENPEYTRGLFPLGKNKWMYVNRGVGSAFPFRWCARPEITLITLQKGESL